MGSSFWALALSQAFEQWLVFHIQGSRLHLAIYRDIVLSCNLQANAVTQVYFSAYIDLLGSE